MILQINTNNKIPVFNIHMANKREETFICKGPCGKELPMSKRAIAYYRKPSGDVQYRGNCKGCQAKKETIRQAIKRLENDPTNFFQCENCLYIFSRKFMRNNGCPKCKSKDIERGDA